MNIKQVVAQHSNRVVHLHPQILVWSIQPLDLKCLAVDIGDGMRPVTAVCTLSAQKTVSTILETAHFVYYFTKHLYSVSEVWLLKGCLRGNMQILSLALMNLDYLSMTWGTIPLAY